MRQNNFFDRETQEKIVNDKGIHITTNVDIRLYSEIETIKDKLESQQEDQEESNTKSVRKKDEEYNLEYKKNRSITTGAVLVRVSDPTFVAYGFDSTCKVTKRFL